MFDYTEKTIRNDRDSSPKRVVCPDDIWQKYDTQAQDEKGATNLRSDTTFLDKLLQLLQTQNSDLLKNKDKKITFQTGIKVLCNIMMKAKSDDDSKIDITKNNKIPTSIFSHIK